MSGTDAAWRRENIGTLLFQATDRCVQEKLAVVHRSGFAAVTDAQLALFHNLDRAGTRLTVLAARAGVTKQSMIELIDKAAAAGLVDRAPDPEDGRARIVRFTARGLDLFDALEQGIAAAEAGVAAEVGDRFLDEMRRALAAYIAAVAHDDAHGPSDETDARNRNIARLFSLAARRFARDALGFVHASDHGGVSEVLLALFRNLDLDGTRLTDIATRARVTKQSMRELVDRAEALGFVARHPDPDDKRARTIRFTPAGLALLDEIRRGIAQAEAHFAGIVGGDLLAQLKARLRAYDVGARHPTQFATPSARRNWREAPVP